MKSEDKGALYQVIAENVRRRLERQVRVRVPDRPSIAQLKTAIEEGEAEVDRLLAAMNLGDS